MPKQINPIRKQILEHSIRSGKSLRQALLNAGYAKSTANQACTLSVVKQIREKVKKELEAQWITEKGVIEELTAIKQLAIQKGDLAVATRCEELIGKHLKMFSDRIEETKTSPDSIIVIDNSHKSKKPIDTNGVKERVSIDTGLT